MLENCKGGFRVAYIKMNNIINQSSKPSESTEKGLVSEGETENVNSSRKSKLIKFCRKLGIDAKFLLAKTPLCRHEFGCLQNILKGTLQSFSLAYLFRLVIRLLGLCFAYKKTMKK